MHDFIVTIFLHSFKHCIFQQFTRPATLNSFVVADFTNNKRSCEEFVGTLLKVADRHGVQIPASTMDIGRRYLDAVTEHCRGGRGHIEDDVSESKIVDFIFFYDSQGIVSQETVFVYCNCGRGQIGVRGSPKVH